MFLELRDVVYIPQTRRNLISVPILDRLGYIYIYIYIYKTLCGDLYKLGLYSFLSFSPNVNTISSTKCLKLNEKSSILWHKHWVIFLNREYLFWG